MPRCASLLLAWAFAHLRLLACKAHTGKALHQSSYPGLSCPLSPRPPLGPVTHPHRSPHHQWCNHCFMFVSLTRLSARQRWHRLIHWYTQALHRYVGASTVLGAGQRAGQKSGPWGHETCNSGTSSWNLRGQRDLNGC